MPLTENQIAELFRFCEKKSVRYYDLQSELVDHLATRIEEEMDADAQLSFEAALQKVYKDFGLFGFAHIVQQKEQELYKQSNRQWWREVKTFFALPKIALTALLFLLAYQTGSFLSPEVRMGLVMLVWFGGYLLQMRFFWRYKKQHTRQLLLTQYVPATTLFTPAFFAQQAIFSFEEISSGLIFALMMVAGIIIHTVFISVTRNITEKAQALYPEAFKTA